MPRSQRDQLSARSQNPDSAEPLCGYVVGKWLLPFDKFLYPYIVLPQFGLSVLLFQTCLIYAFSSSLKQPAPMGAIANCELPSTAEGSTWLQGKRVCCSYKPRETTLSCPDNWSRVSVFVVQWLELAMYALFRVGQKEACSCSTIVKRLWMVLYKSNENSLPRLDENLFTIPCLDFGVAGSSWQAMRHVESSPSWHQLRPV